MKLRAVHPLRSCVSVVWYTILWIPVEYGAEREAGSEYMLHAGRALMAVF